MWKSKHGPNIANLFAVYQAGPTLIGALEQYVLTQEGYAREAAKDDVAQTVCIGLHNGPPTGLLCRACVEGEQMAPMLATVESEMEAAKETK